MVVRRASNFLLLLAVVLITLFPGIVTYLPEPMNR